MFDWSGRYGADGSPIPNTSEGSFVFREDVPSSVVVEGGEVDPVPTRSGGKGGLMEEVVELRRIGVWQERVEGLLEERIRMAETKRREKEVMFRKVIAICSNVPLELIGSVSSTSLLSSFVGGREERPRLTLLRFVSRCADARHANNGCRE